MAGDDKQDYNSMQAGMGIIPPNLVPMYSAPHPGDFSAHIAQQAIMQTQQVTQMGMQARSFSPLATMNPFVQVGGAPMMQMPSAVPNMLSGMGPPTGMFPPASPGAGFGAFGASPYRQMSPMGGGGYVGQTPPMSPFPFQPRLPQPFFNTPFMSGYQREELGHENMQAQSIAAGGMGARMGTNLLMGGIGAAIGSRFGMGRLGAVAGFGASEFGGLGGMAQNMWMNTVGASQAAMAGRTAGIQDFSRNMITTGPFMSESGSGFSRAASMQAAHGLTSLASSTGFQRETGGRFNTNDMFRIAQTGAENGLMQGVQSPTEMTQRVREVAKSLKLVMELANEPDVRQAIQTMGSLRGMGMNLAQTTDAISQGRAFARQAGMTFQQLAATGGAMGAQTFQSMGMSQGQGLLAGMHAVGSAQASINQGVLSPLMANLVGGAQGYGALNTAFSGQMAQSPMWAAMLNGRGGMSASSMQAAMSGRAGVFDMPGMAANNFSSIAGRMGTEGLGMALGMQHYAQSSMMAATTPEQRRIMEDRQVMGMSRSLGYRGGAGFMTAAQMMGMSGDQAQARLTEISDPRYYDRQRSQIDTTRAEMGSIEARRRRDMAPSFFEQLQHDSPWLRGVMSAGGGDVARAGEMWDRMTGYTTIGTYSPGSREAAQSDRNFTRSRRYSRMARQAEEASAGPREIGWSEHALAFEGEYGIGGLGAQIGGGLLHLNGGRRSTRQQLEAAEGSGQIANIIMNTSARTARRAQRDTAGLFQGDNGTQFSQSVANLINNPRGAFGQTQAGGSIGTGLISAATSMIPWAGLAAPATTGSMQTNNLESQIRNAFIASQRRQGVSEDRAAQTWDQRRTQIMASQASTIRFMSDSSGANTLNVAAQRGAGASSSSRMQEVTGNQLREDYSAAFGTSTLEANDERIEGMRDIRHSMEGYGFGRTESERTRSRTLLSTMAQVRLAMTNGTAPIQARARQRFQELSRIAQRQLGGNYNQALDVVTQQTDALRTGGNSRRAIRAASAMVGNAGSADVLLRRQQGLEEDESLHANLPAETAGFERMRSLSTGVRDLIGNAHNMSELNQTIGGISQDRLDEMARSRNNVERTFATAAIAARNGDEGRLRTFFRDQGRERIQAQERFNQRYGGVTGMARRIFGDGGLGDGARIGENFEQFESRTQATGGQADLNASNQTANVTDAQRQADAQGLTSATDNFNRAIEEFRTAIHELRGNTDAATANGMLNRD